MPSQPIRISALAFGGLGGRLALYTPTLQRSTPATPTEAAAAARTPNEEEGCGSRVERLLRFGDNLVRIHRAPLATSKGL
jgi:hypothetical protein